MAGVICQLGVRGDGSPTTNKAHRHTSGADSRMFCPSRHRLPLRQDSCDDMVR